MFPKILRIEPHADRTLTVVFEDGREGDVDLRPLISRGGIYTAMNDDAFFFAATTAANRRSVVWPDDQIELGADGLARDLRPTAVSRRSVAVA